MCHWVASLQTSYLGGHLGLALGSVYKKNILSFPLVFVVWFLVFIKMRDLPYTGVCSVDQNGCQIVSNIIWNF